MCECGCYNAGQLFKLASPTGLYLVRTMPGCAGCGVGPAVVIECPPRDQIVEWEYDRLPDLPMTNGVDGVSFCAFKTGPTLHEAIFDLKGLATPSEPFDEITADTIAEENWNANLSGSPQLVKGREG